MGVINLLLIGAAAAFMLSEWISVNGPAFLGFTIAFFVVSMGYTARKSRS